MTPLTGLPDFQNRLASLDFEAYAPFGAGACSVIPSQLEIALDSAGSPKFQLQLVKHAGDTNPAGQYGVMDLSLAGEYPSDAVLAAARSAIPGATIASTSIDSGFARLYSTTASVALPSAMTSPVALGWAGSDFARWTAPAAECRAVASGRAAKQRDLIWSAGGVLRNRRCAAGWSIRSI